MRGWTTAAIVVLTVAYPFVIYGALASLSARSVGVLALSVAIPLFALRLRAAPPAQRRAVLRVPLVVLALLVLGAAFDDERFVLATPVVVSLALLAVFGASLRGPGPTQIEAFARLQEPDLSPAQVAHCRQATVAWCVFFVANAAIAGGLALAGARAAWALYTGGIAYGLMGMLFAGEYVVRQARFRDYGDALPDRLLARVFPPRDREAAAGEGTPR